MSEEKGYSGWTNYETWCVNLWWSNDEPTYKALREAASNHWGRAKAGEVLTRSEEARHTLSDGMKELVEEGAANYGEQSSVYSDLLTAAISDVDWYELADAWLRDTELDGYEPK